jgi:hypothetical protein
MVFQGVSVCDSLLLSLSRDMGLNPLQRKKNRTQKALKSNRLRKGGNRLPSADAAGDGIGHGRKDDRDRPRLPLEGKRSPGSRLPG